jgi:8-oxo-dGTP pyrophosphatase MutT (NUDIX family)
MENIKRSSVEMAPLAPGARNYTRIIKKVRDVGESTQNRKFFHAVVDSQRTIEKIFKDLLIRELGNDLYSQLERWLKSFGRVLSTASELGRDIDYDLPIEIMANNVSFTPEKLSNTLVSAAQRIAPDIAEALESQTALLQKLLVDESNPDSMDPNTTNRAEAAQRNQLLFTRALNVHIVKEVDREDLVASMLELAMDGEPLPIDLPRGVESELRSLASKTMKPGGMYEQPLAIFRERFLAYFHTRIATLPVPQMNAQTEEFVNAAERFPSIAQQIMSSVRSTEADIERFTKAPPGAPLGRIAFSPERMKREKIPYEPNTEIERSLKQDAWLYAHANSDFKPASVDLIKQLIAQGHYDDAIRFTDPSVGTVYRGMAVQSTEISYGFGSELSKQLAALREGDIATFNVSSTYKSRNRSSLSSWTDHPGVGVSFAGQASMGMEGKTYMMVLHAQVSDNPEGFLDALNLFKKIDVTNPELLNEREHFGLGDIRVSKITVAVIDADDLASSGNLGARMETAVRAGSDTRRSTRSSKVGLSKSNHNFARGGKIYWGIGGAGMIFVCPDDGTVFLQKRSGAVTGGAGKWAFPGGGIHPDAESEDIYPQDQGDGHWMTPIPDELVLTDNDRHFEDTAKDEVVEECGSLPGSWRFVDSFIYEDDGFKYKTFVAAVPLASKKAWMPESQASYSWESSGMRWFSFDEFKQLESEGKLFFGFTEELKSKVIRAMTGS